MSSEALLLFTSRSRVITSPSSTVLSLLGIPLLSTYDIIALVFSLLWSFDVCPNIPGNRCRPQSQNGINLVIHNYRIT